MNNHSFNSIQLADGSQMNLYAAFPDGQGSHPAILVFQEAFGVNNHIRNCCERLCNEGYSVVAPELFHRSGQRVEIAYTDFPSAMPHMKVVTTESIIADVQAAFTWLEQQPRADTRKTGSIGFCLGGRASFIANTVLPLSAAVSYYGGGLENLTAEAVNLQSPHLFYWGGKDTHIPVEKREAIIDAVKAADKDYTNVVISYADHGFNCDERASYNPLAAEESWGHTLSFFENRLK